MSGAGVSVWKIIIYFFSKRVLKVSTDVTFALHAVVSVFNNTCLHLAVNWELWWKICFYLHFKKQTMIWKYSKCLQKSESPAELVLDRHSLPANQYLRLVISFVLNLPANQYLRLVTSFVLFLPANQYLRLVTSFVLLSSQSVHQVSHIICTFPSSQSVPQISHIICTSLQSIST
jgi:hypothetical protein